MVRCLSPCPILSVLVRVCRSARPASLRFVRKRKNRVPAASPVFQRSLSLCRPKSRGKFAGAVIAHRSGDLCNAGLRFFPKQQSRPIHPQCPHIGVHRTAIYTFETGLHGGQRDLVLSGQSLQCDTPQQVELVREELGLDQPIFQQYGSWLWNALHGNFGNSYNTGRPIVEELSASIQPTLVMATMALLFADLLSIPLGVLSASRKGGLADRSIYLFGIICMSLPNYWIGFMLLLAFAVYIPIFSIMGADSLKDFILPALALAIPMAAGNIRVFRSSLLDGYNSDFVLYARARGVSEWKIANLVSRFALPPLITMLAQSFGFMIAGSAMVESVFSIPGLGSMLVTALGARDTITINACVLITAVIFVLVNFMIIKLSLHKSAQQIARKQSAGLLTLTLNEPEGSFSHSQRVNIDVPSLSSHLTICPCCSFNRAICSFHSLRVFSARSSSAVCCSGVRAEKANSR